MIRIFSKRHEQAIYERKLGLSLAKRLRKRIWGILEKHDFYYDYQPDPNDGWTTQTSVLVELPKELCRRYGADHLVAFKGGDERVPVQLPEFVLGAFPGQVFDVVELFYQELPDAQKPDFSRELNHVFEEEGVAWRMTDGQFFKVDSEFLELHVIARSYELMKAEGFDGALDEFNESRNDLASGDFKGAIHNAAKSLESVLKAILNRDSGNASVLIRELAGVGFYSDVPEDIARSFGEQVLTALPYLRNRLGGHGQGQEVLDVPRAYAELAVHLAASFIHFAIKQHVSISSQTKEKASTRPGDDQIPF